MKVSTLLVFIFSMFLFSTPMANAGYLMAQNFADEDDSYDPFADYSEFEENSQEEADINFFRNGRFFTMGFLIGQRGFTNTLNQLYKSNGSFGIALSYFFDLRFALQFGFNTGDHQFYIPHLTDPLTGSVSFTAINFDLKFYMNTQNVTKGLADINPYILIGFSQYQRTYMVAGQDGFAKDSALAFDGGAGIEIPIFRNKMYLGLQGTYHYVSFPDENTELVWGTDNSIKSGIYPNGNIYDVYGILGLNF